MNRRSSASEAVRILGSLILVSCGLLSGCSVLVPSASVSPSYNKEDSPRQIAIENRSADLLAVFGSADGKSLWAVGDGGTILHSSDGQHWESQTGGTTSASRRWSRWPGNSAGLKWAATRAAPTSN